ncbi:ABC transporter, permease protein [Bacillus cereus F65185]|nr:ABC transporter, permease protein [Bacillus cereus F65185]
MIPKYNTVLPIAPVEIANLYLFIGKSNNFNANVDNPCDTPIPIISPLTKDITPTRNVSVTNILDMFLLPIPKVMYIPNSFLRFLIKKLFAYNIKPPNITDTNTDTFEITFIKVGTYSLPEASISISAFCDSIELKL